MEQNNNSEKSAWNEQQSFSKIYFEQSNRCREAQRARDLMAWRIALECKISAGIAILKEEQTKDIVEKKQQVRMKSNDLLSTKDKKQYIQLCGEFSDMLFYTELKMDQYVNDNMPFLRIEEEVDVGDF